ncbi:MAG TPA: hypothetical protein PKE39_10035 [Ignavibacteria bacterium]|nr:hypothetical protein [Ignavibacteria bacterium]HMQ99351.1 hypothetical protein [Ignavibacteria bacterium]
MKNEPDFNIDKAHRWFGVEFNNAIFPLLEKENRTDEETQQMIQMAFASTLHWSRFSGCKIENRARGENMIATVLTYAGMKDASIFYAKRNHDIVFSNLDGVADFDISYALMIMARAYALNERFAEAEQFYQQCLDSIDEIKDEEDKKIVQSDLNNGPWYGLNE